MDVRIPRQGLNFRRMARQAVDGVAGKHVHDGDGARGEAYRRVVRAVRVRAEGHAQNRTVRKLLGLHWAVAARQPPRVRCRRKPLSMRSVCVSE